MQTSLNSGYPPEPLPDGGAKIEYNITLYLSAEEYAAWKGVESLKIQLRDTPAARRGFQED